MTLHHKIRVLNAYTKTNVSIINMAYGAILALSTRNRIGLKMKFK